MPIFVHWKWDSKRQDFIVVFHFDNDYSSSNLRNEKMAFDFTGIDKFYSYESLYQYEHAILPAHIPEVLKEKLKGITQEGISRPDKLRTVITWAPSHIELGLLSEILTYANIVNGLKPNVRSELRGKLQLESFFLAFNNWWKKCEEGIYEEWEDVVLRDSEEFAHVLDRLQNKAVLFSSEISKNPKESQFYMIFPVCQEYVDYLKEVLKPYMRERESA